MKNVFKALAIIVLAALIVFSMVACDDGSGGPGGGGGSGTGGGGGRGTLTITGLPRGDWSVAVFPAGTDLSTFDAIIAALGDVYPYGFEAVSGRPSNNVFILDPPGVGPDSYTGSGRKEVLLTDDDADYYNFYYYATVNFSNGSATVAFSSFRLTTMPSY